MSRRLPALIPLALLLAWVLYIFSPLVADPDLWGHVRFGQDTLLTGQVIRADTYSYLTAGQPWVNHEWLTEVIYGLAYNLAGSAGLFALNLLLVLAILGLLYVHLVRAGTGSLAALLLTAGISMVLRPAALNVRPQVLTYLLFLLLLLLLEVYSRRPDSRARRLRTADLLFVAGAWCIVAVWVNLHGGVLAGLGVLYLYGLSYLAEAVVHKRSLRVLAQPRYTSFMVALLLAPTALLANPYGPRLVTFLLRTATVARPEILEWQGVRLTDIWSLDWLAAVAVTAVAIVFSRRPRRLSSLIPLAVVALLPLSAIRHIPLAAIAMPVLAADHFAGLWHRLVSHVGLSGSANYVGGRHLTRVANLTGLVAAALLLVLAAPRLGKIVIDPFSVAFPARTVAILQASGARGNMATEFNWGEYVLWHLGPDVQVSVDGRRETVYGDAVYRENLDFMLGQGEWDRLVNRPETDLALVDRGRPAYNLMLTKADWTLAYEDRTAALFVRGGHHLDLDTNRIPAAWPPDGAGIAFPVE